MVKSPDEYASFLQNCMCRCLAQKVATAFPVMQIAWHPEGAADDAEQEAEAASAHPAAEHLDGAEEDTWPATW